LQRKIHIDQVSKPEFRVYISGGGFLKFKETLLAISKIE